jgi:glutaredoxin
MSWEIVNGPKDKGDVKLYALSTCIWCKRTKRLLDEAGVKYKYIYADLLDDKSHMELVYEMNEHVDDISFPTVVVNDDIVIEGYDEKEIRRILCE